MLQTKNWLILIASGVWPVSTQESVSNSNDLLQKVTLWCCIAMNAWPGDKDYADIDIFCLGDAEKIAEHRDVLQVVPDNYADDNGMLDFVVS